MDGAWQKAKTPILGAEGLAQKTNYKFDLWILPPLPKPPKRPKRQFGGHRALLSQIPNWLFGGLDGA